MIKAIGSNFRPLSVTTMIFAGGEVQVSVDGPEDYGDSIQVVARLHSSDDVMALLLVVDALRRKYGSDAVLNLICPYLPYARQDRVMNEGESLALRVMCDLINSLKFANVVVYDVHSDAALATLNNAKSIGPERVFEQIIRRTTSAKVDPQSIVLVAPDAGSLKKVGKFAKKFGCPMVRADKTRSTVDGAITGTTVYSEHIGDKDFLIVDDICDGGRTFLELAKVLKPLTSGRVLLYVTHGIFSRGLDPFEGLIDHIFVAASFPGVDTSNPLITVLEKHDD